MKLASPRFHSVACFLVIAWFGAGCAGPKSDVQRTESFALTSTDETNLAKLFIPKVMQHPEQAGLRPMLSGVDAFAARLTLANLAQRSLDVQYYIWDPDDTGKLLAQHLLAAAQRGVRVRMLLDDFGAIADDQRMLALANQPNIEVRLFNPMAARGNDVMGMMLDFSQATRRMHNKSFIADNQVAIVGGRNIGDEYFHADSEMAMLDFDVMAVGPVVHDVSKQFDTYWNCPGAIPIQAVTHQPLSPDALAAGLDRLKEHEQKMKASQYGQSLAQSPLVNEIQSGDAKFFWGKATLMYDDPNKIVTLSNDPKDRLLPRVSAIGSNVQKELFIISPYFVPGDAGVEFFRKLCERGVRVVILTNSMSSTDALPAYAAYSRYRERLLSCGVELYELKPTAAYRPRPGKITGDPDSHTTLHGSSQAALHAKTFNFDRQSVFVGSLNLDPRSAHLNTEVGVVFEDPQMARDWAERFESALPNIAWRVEAVPDKFFFFDTTRLNWVTQENGSTVRLTDEPGQTISRNLEKGLTLVLPIESQL